MPGNEGTFSLPGVLLCSRLRRNHLLNGASRDEIYQTIQASPGIHLTALQEVLARGQDRPPMAFGTLVYHLGRMERFGLVVSKREGRYRRYFDAGSGLGADAARVALLQTMPVPLVARAVLERPALTQSELLEALTGRLVLSRQALAYHLRRLAQKDLVRIERVGPRRRYHPTQRLARLARFLDPPARVGQQLARPPREPGQGTLADLRVEPALGVLENTRGPGGWVRVPSGPPTPSCKRGNQFSYIREPSRVVRAHVITSPSDGASSRMALEGPLPSPANRRPQRPDEPSGGGLPAGVALSARAGSTPPATSGASSGAVREGGPDRPPFDDDFRFNPFPEESP